MSVSTSKKIQPGYEPIEGYVLEKLIGRGSYGEVWQAEAPGGLKKAVKFVFGHHDERRATQELKSLERIKGVQHPFILTLERFELIDNQLVIVTELADGSLEDVHKQHRERDSCGIPRAALLAYLKDTADALDYLHQLYKLQHLDIKPANLLIVGGHVKVADFGLLKDLGEVDCSIVGGLTPIYAPPELFDGRPSLHSDQYSLAVMYQELLTGTRPFTGRTIAQLATQHVHNAPNLEPLPACDRPVIARALEKSPDRRYGSCTEFVAKLLDPRSSQSGPRPTSDTHDSDASNDPEHRVEDLPQLQAAAGIKRNLSTRSALVIALGGTGADVLHAIRNRVTPLRSASPVTVHSLLIDVDPIASQKMQMIESTECMPECHVVSTPLRTAHQYRDNGTEHLRTISRRWIYNVPRNEVTGGMRPIGRLALVDHGQKVSDAIALAIEDLKGQRGDNEVSIYVVGSLAGGTGSGMYIDVVHLLRHLLDEAGLQEQSIISLLTTNRLQGDPNRLLGLHGTRAALNEMRFFMKPGNGYPGDPGAGWPAVPSARTPLRDAYLIAESDVAGAPSPIETVANYLWADATTCNELLQAGRAQSTTENDGSIVDIPQIRSAGVVQINDASRVQAGVLATPTARELFVRWLGNPKLAEENSSEFIQRLCRRCHLTPNEWIERTLRWFGKDRDDRRSALMKQLRSATTAQVDGTTTNQTVSLQWLESQINPDAKLVAIEEIIGTIQHEIQLRLQNQEVDLVTSIEAICGLKQYVTESIDELDRLSGQSLDSNEEPGHGKKLAFSNEISLRNLRMACDREEAAMHAAAARLAANTARMLTNDLNVLEQLLSHGAAKVATVIQKLKDGGSAIENPWESIDEGFKAQFEPLMSKLHEKTNAKSLSQMVGADVKLLTPEIMMAEVVAVASDLISILFQDDYMVAEHDSQPKPMGSKSTVASSDSIPCNVTEVLYSNGTESLGVTGTQSFGGASQSTKPPLDMSEAVSAVRPTLLSCGGKQRLMLVCGTPQELIQYEPEVTQAHEGALSTFVTRSASPMLIHEAQQISLDSILNFLTSISGDDGRVSRRLAGRTDLDFEKGFQ